MNLLKIVNQINPDTFEEEVKDDFMNRKAALSKMGNWSKKLALSALPMGALAAFAEPVRAQTSRTVTDVLNYALTLEYLEATFYTMAKDADVYPPPSSGNADVAFAHIQPTFDEIEQNERQHVAFLEGALGGDAIDKPAFNFNVAGLKPFENYDHFILLAQTFEDTGVRAYKGQAGFLMDAPDILTAALQIHSVEARHAAAVRRLRGDQGWILRDNAPASAVQASYDGEANTTHATIDVTSISNVSADAITEAWDEPLKTQDVLAIVDPFITSN